MPRETFAARAAKWSAAHWKTATFGWLAFVVAAIVVGSAVGSVKLTDAEQATGEAAQTLKTIGEYMKSAVTVDWDSINENRPRWNERWNKSIER